MKQKGFTLIEIITVIIILGIVTLIIIPSVSVVLEKSKKNILKSTATNLTRIISQQCNEEKMDGKDITSNYVVRNGKTMVGNVEVDNLPEDAKIDVTDDCQVNIAIVDDEYCVIKDDNEIVINENIYHCGEEYIEVPETEPSCFIFDETTHTITGYDYENASCPADISIPATINSIPVEHIAPLAFYNQADTVLFAEASSGEVEDIDFWVVVDRVENIEKFNYNKIYVEAYKIKNNNMKKRCYSDPSNPSKYTNKPINYVINDTDTFVVCDMNFSNYREGIDYEILDGPGLNRVDLSKAINLISIGDGAFMRNTITSVNFESLPKLRDIGVNVFANNNISDSVDLTGLESIEHIPNAMFSTNTITDVKFNKNIKSIGIISFYRNNLNNISLPTGLEKIKYSAFAVNPLTNVIFPNTITYLSGFCGNDFSEVNIPEGVVKIGRSAFCENKVENLYFPSSVEEIHYDAFSDNLIRNVELSSNLKYIGDFSFARNNISEIEIPNKVEYLSGFASNYIEDLNIPSSVNTIGGEAFCGNLIKSLTIPGNVSTILNFAFCSNQMEELVLNTGLKNIGQQAFYNNRIEELIIPSGIQNISYAAFNRNALTGGSRFIKLIKNGRTYNNTIISYGGAGNSDDVINIPSGITTIEIGAFFYIQPLEVNIPDSVTTIKNSSFGNVDREEAVINIGSGVTSIGNSSFNCINNQNKQCEYTINISKYSTDTINKYEPWGNIYAKINWLPEPAITATE